MVSSQDTAVAAALHELGYRLPLRVEIVDVTKGAPADGKLRAHDRVIKVDGQTITDVSQVSKAIQRAGVGKPTRFVVRRGGVDRDRHGHPEGVARTTRRRRSSGYRSSPATTSRSTCRSVSATRSAARAPG